MISGKSVVGSSGINGDKFYVSNDERVLFLADGASGAGDEGKVKFGEICVNILKEHPFDNETYTPKNYLENIIWDMNQRLIDYAQTKRHYIYGTIAVVLVNQDKVWTACIGDSPIYLKDSKGIKQCSRPMKRFEGMIEQGYFTKEEYEGYITNMHPMLWSSFDVFFPQIIPPIKIEEHVVNEPFSFYMCCDGISDWLEAKDIFFMLEQEISVDQIIEAACDKSMKANGYIDDMTLVHYKRG